MKAEQQLITEAGVKRLSCPSLQSSGLFLNMDKDTHNAANLLDTHVLLRVILLSAH